MRVVGSVDFSEKTWIIDAEPHVLMRLKNVFRKVNVNQRRITIKHTDDVAIDLDWFLKRYKLKMSEAVRQFLDFEVARINRLNEEIDRIFLPGYESKKFEASTPLYDFQTVGVEFGSKTKRYLNGDVVGLGKTPQGVGMSFIKDALPVLAVVQAHLPKQWAGEIARFNKNATIHFCKGRTPYSLPAADFYIITYSCLSGWANTLKGFVKGVVFDEIQELRREESDKYSSAKIVADTASYVWGLSATPIFNYGDEMYNIMNVIKEGALGDKAEFLREWGSSWTKKIRDPQAFGAFLREQRLFLRRTREEVGAELPEIQKIIQNVGYDKKESDKVEDLAKQLAIKTVTGSFVERGQAARELDVMVRHATGVSKMKYVAEYVRMLLESGERVLLALWHRDCYEIIQKELSDYVISMYTGSESPSQKEQSKQDFISGKSRLMMISLRSGVGLDGLQDVASIVVFGELDWSPAIHEQVEGRLRRNGQRHQVTSIYLISDFGSDPLIVDLLGVKSQQQEAIVDPFNTGVKEVLNDDSRIKALAKKFLEQRGISV